MTRQTGPATDAEGVVSLFARHGLRCTRQRRALYQALAATDTHPTADDLHQALSAHEVVSLATVYNSLQALCQAGLAIKIAGRGSSARYDAVTHDHLHLRDGRTGQIYDLPKELSDQLLAHLPRELLAQLQQRHGFKLHRVQIELVGEMTSNS